LGQIVRDPSNPQEPYDVNLDRRPYVGLVGEKIVAPSGRARVDVGVEDASGHHFAVYLSEDDVLNAGKNQARLNIDENGDVKIRGQTTVDGELHVVDGAAEFGCHQEAEQTAARPWQVYRVCQDGETELRIEMAAGGEGLNRVVIGFWSADDEEFKPCLTIDDGCKVTVHGNLHVKGQINKVVRVQGLDETAQQFSVAAFYGGMAGTNVLLDRYQPQVPGVEIVRRDTIFTAPPGGGGEVVEG
jgi:hypothetical protein